MALSNVDINNFAKKSKIKNYRGCFSKDTLPPIRKIGFYVINMQDADDGDGTHWVLARQNSGSSDYMDSFAVPPPLDVINYFTEPINQIKNQIQDIDSIKCGYFCQYFMKELNKGRSLEEIMSDFNIENLKENDNIV